MSFTTKFFSTAVVFASFAVQSVAQAGVIPANIPIAEDVMTSGFFSVAPNFVRGYAGDSRNIHRVSTNAPFSTAGAETIYVAFNSAEFSSYTTSIPQAFLTLESVSGGFGADAGSGNPFTVSAHAVNADPLTDIADDGNGGTISWLDFFNNNILSADAAAHTSIDSFGTVKFDVTAIVNDWISGSNTDFTIALTGKNDTSGNAFLHGFLNNTENPGSTFLSIVPEPSTALLGFVALIGMLSANGRRRESALG